MTAKPRAAIAPLLGVLALVALILLPVTLREGLAQGIMDGGILEEIRVEGTQRIEPETVRSYMRLNLGEPFDPQRIDRSLKSLFATGLFQDVTLRRDGSALVVTVVENPIINRISFEGNNRIDDEALEAEIQLRPRTVFTRTKAQTDVARILELYRRSGRFAATVEPSIIEQPQNRVDLVFEINEGPLTTIKAVNFIGNEAFSDSALADVITTTEAAWWKFFVSGDTYDPDRINFDQDLLRRFYLNEGYADFRVLSAVAELTPDREGFIVTFTVEEGARYTFGAIGINSNLKDLDEGGLTEALTMEEGDWYDASAVEETIGNLTEMIGNRGFAFVDVRPTINRDREARTIGVTFDISEGPRVYVERIDIQGNLRTLDSVVRREFRLVEGDAFNAALIRRSRQRIRNLGFFRTVEITNTQGSAPDRTVITAEVEDQSTGELTFGAGFSSAVGPIGSIQLRERNLLGRGQDLRLGLQISGSRSELDLSFTEPYFLDRDLAAGFDLFRITTDQQDDASFDEVRIGGALRAGFDWSERLRHIFRYSFVNKKITNIEPDASLIIVDEEGTRTESAVSHELSYDTRDNRFDPREGLVLRLSNKFAGLGGDASYLRSTVGGAVYFPLFHRDLTGSIQGELGNIFGIAEDTRVSERFFLGGSSVRGFEPAGIGPRDQLTGDALGGKNFYNATAEISFPLGLPDEYAIRGRLFTDMGATWDIDNTLGVQVNDSTAPRISVGAGLSWNSAFGPLTIDIGYPIVKEDFDQTEFLRFSFGTSF